MPMEGTCAPDTFKPIMTNVLVDLKQFLVYINVILIVQI